MGKETAAKLEEQLMQFGQLPEQCNACHAPFDKKSKEMAKTWNVVVPDETTVRLYCPQCWNTAIQAVATFKEEIESEQERQEQEKKEPQM